MTRLNITISDEQMVENIENAFSFVEEELDVEINRSRGRNGDGEISTAEAVEELALAYSGDFGNRSADIPDNGSIR